MAYASARKGRIAVKEQGSGWGTAETSFVAGDVVEGEVVLPPLTKEALQTQTFKTGVHEDTIVAGSKAGVEVSLSMPLHGFSSSTPSADPTEHVDALLIKNAMGASVQTGYSTDQDGGSTTVPEFTASQASANWEGSAQLYTLTGGSTYMIGWVANVATATPDTATLIAQYPSSTAPAAATATAYGSNTCYLTPVSTQPTALTLQWLGSDSAAAIRFWDGIVTSITISGDTKGQPRLAATLRFLNWTIDGTGGAPTPAAYSNPQCPAMVGANSAAFYVGTTDTCIATFSYEVTVETGEAACISGDQGVSQITVLDRRATLTTTGPTTTYAAATFPEPGTDKDPAQLVLNTTPGRAVGILIADPVIKAQATPADSNGLLGVTTTYGAQIYTGDDGAGAGAGDSPTRVAFL